MDDNEKIEAPHFNRVEPRRRVQMTIEIHENQTQQVVGRLFDVSKDGFMLVGKIEIYDNQEYDFLLNLTDFPKFNVTIPITAECRWSQTFDKTGYFGSGFLITQMDPVYLPHWKQLIEEFSED